MIIGLSRRRALRGRTNSGHWLLGAVAFAYASQAGAQSPTRPAPTIQTQPPVQLEQLEQEQQRQSPVSVPRLSEDQGSMSADQAPLFLLAAVEIQGATAIDPGSLSDAYAPYIGLKLSQADLLALAGAVTERYRAAGYHLSRAIIPPQDLAGGRLRLQLVEGAIEEIRVAGEVTADFGLQELLAPVAAERPSRLSTLERQLLLANERPGLRITDTALDEIGTATGRFRLTVTAQSWRVFSAAGVDNTGSESVGPWQASASLAFNSIVVAGDSLVIAGSMVPNASKEMRFGRVAYDMPLGTSGVRVGVSASRSEVWPGDTRRQLRTYSQAETYEARIAYAPLLTQRHSLWLTAAIGISDVVEKDMFGKTFGDRIGLASLTADYKLQATQDSTTYVSATYRQGLGLIDPTPSSTSWLSRAGASPHFSLVNASLTHYQSLGRNWSVKLAAAGQLASGPLLTSQQFYLGGLSFGRGFDGGWISGDDAIAGSAELRYDYSRDLTFMKGIQLYAFMEGGVARTRLQPGHLDQTLVSAGAGFRVFVNDDLQVGLAIAKPIAENGLVRANRGVSVLFSLSNILRFCPDRTEKFCRG